MSSVAGCAGFSAVCGDSLATAVTMGTIAVPEMKKKNYSMRLATGCLAAGGTLGILIPPSVLLVVLGPVVGVSVVTLFVSAMIPEFGPLVGRVYHDVFHVYTADIHAIKALELLQALSRGERDVRALAALDGRTVVQPGRVIARAPAKTSAM